MLAQPRLREQVRFLLASPHQPCREGTLRSLRLFFFFFSPLSLLCARACLRYRAGAGRPIRPWSWWRARWCQSCDNISCQVLLHRPHSELSTSNPTNTISTRKHSTSNTANTISTRKHSTSKLLQIHVLCCVPLMTWRPPGRPRGDDKTAARRPRRAPGAPGGGHGAGRTAWRATWRLEEGILSVESRRGLLGS